MTNRINHGLSRQMSVEELDLVSGGNGASEAVTEEQIETLVVSGSYGGISSGTVNALGATTVGSLGGGYGAFQQGYISGAINTAAAAATNEAGQGLQNLGEWGMAAGTAIGVKLGPVGKYIGGAGAVIWGIGKSMQGIEP